MRADIRWSVFLVLWALCYCSVRLGHQTGHFDSHSLKNKNQSANGTCKRKKIYVSRPSPWHVTATSLTDDLQTTRRKFTDAADWLASWPSRSSPIRDKLLSNMTLGKRIGVVVRPRGYFKKHIENDCLRTVIEVLSFVPPFFSYGVMGREGRRCTLSWREGKRERKMGNFYITTISFLSQTNLSSVPPCMQSVSSDGEQQIINCVLYTTCQRSLIIFFFLLNYNLPFSAFIYC